MLSSFALIFLFGILFAALCKKINIPNIIGMLFVGILIGNYGLNLLDEKTLLISSELRQIALIIILLKAGLSLDINDLKRIGVPAFLMSFVPAIFEIIAFVLFAPNILHISITEACIIGAVLGAVSPAVVVPRMTKLIENGYGVKKGIPQLIIAGSSLDDVFVIVLFYVFIGMEQGDGFNASKLIKVPISIILGILLGILSGIMLSSLFEHSYKKGKIIRGSMKVIIMIGVAFTLISIEEILKDIISISGLIAIITLACVIKIKLDDIVVSRLVEKYEKLWLAAEVILFVLVGASINIKYTINAGIPVVIMIIIGLLIRSIGVLLCLINTKFTFKEKMFCVISYIPKATVQAAICSIPLSLGLACGDIVITIAVVSIIMTAPIGAYLIDKTYKQLLNLY